MSLKSELTRLKKLSPDWQRLAGDWGYQHNGQHLGDHILEVIDRVMADRRFRQLSPEYQRATALAAFFHDFGKPTGRRGDKIPRIDNHEEKSRQIAAAELKKYGYDGEMIGRVKFLIQNDKVMSEYGRDRLHRRQTGTPPPGQLAKGGGGDRRLVTAVYILNRADVICAGRDSGRPDRWNKIRPFVNEYFAACLKETK